LFVFDLVSFPGLVGILLFVFLLRLSMYEFLLISFVFLLL